MTVTTERQKLWDKIKDVRIAMMTTVETDDTLRSRPMYLQQAEFDGNLWFFTRDDSGKVQEIMHNKQVNLGFSDPSDDLYVSVSGKAQITDDRAKEEDLWNPTLKAWFPDGLDDPHLTLIRVSADQAEYWDSPSSKMVQLYGFVKAAVTGERADPGENEKLNL
ncbi:pyridoxamine 5'-phosphate oxidase family protein [soil metagenome]